MLVLSRKIGETLHIGDNVVIEIKRVAGSRVTIAIDAPRELRILRGEIKEAATEFDEPANLANGVSAPTPDKPLPREPVAEAVQVKPYVVSHPPINPPGIVPGW